MIIQENATSTFTPTPEGTHPIRCSALIDMGTSEATFEGKTRSRRRVRIVFEVCDPDMTAPSGEPFAIARTFTASLGERSALRPFLESWRGRAFTTAELAGFDLKTVLRAPGLASVVHETRADGKTFANVKSLAKLPRGMAVEPLRTEPLFWDMDATPPDWGAFERLSDRAKDEIGETPEFRKLKRPADTTAPAGAGDTDLDSDIPF